MINEQMTFAGHAIQCSVDGIMLVFVQKVTFILMKIHLNCCNHKSELLFMTQMGLHPNPTEGACSAGATTSKGGDGWEGRGSSPLSVTVVGLLCDEMLFCYYAALCATVCLLVPYGLITQE